MVIAGPNGVGKSSVLAGISEWKDGEVTASPRTLPRYVPPLRALVPRVLKNQDVIARRNSMPTMLAALEGANVAPWVTSIRALDNSERNQQGHRQDNVDLTASAGVKYGLAEIEQARTRRMAALVDAHRRHGKALDAAAVPDVYAPFRGALSQLLPHLHFDKVTAGEGDAFRCVFVRRDPAGERPVDLDWLSSGEKAVVTMLAPLLEARMWELVDEIAPADPPGHYGTTEPRRSLLLLIDEPEQHLHPELQVRLLRHLRSRSQDQDEQFVLATQSPTIVEECQPGELYLLRHATADGENQLIPVESQRDLLDTIRSLAGGLAPLTSGRPLLLVEGEVQARNRATDIELIEVLAPAVASRFVILPAGGKGEVANQLRRLRQLIAAGQFGVPCLALVDADSGCGLPEGTVAWPVATIENLLLLSSKAVANALRVLPGPDAARASHDVDRMLEEAGRRLRAHEISIRVGEGLKLPAFRPRFASPAELEESLAERHREIDERRDKAAPALREATQAVDSMLDDGSFINRFRGKDLLEELYSVLGLAEHQVGYRQFVLALAKSARADPEVLTILDGILTRLTDQLPTR
jgi:hypothetical protein